MNITHSVDAFLVQEMGARCNYDKELLLNKQSLIMDYTGGDVEVTDRTKVPSLDVLPLITEDTIKEYSMNYLAQLLETIERSLEYKPFPVLFNHQWWL